MPIVQHKRGSADAMADPLGLGLGGAASERAVQRRVADDAIDAPKEDSITEDRATIQAESSGLSPRQLAKAQRRNPHWADKLGFRPADFGSSASLNSAEFANDVASAQRDNGLAVDGIAGPKTHRALASGGAQLEDGVLGPADELESGVLGPDDELESGVLGADDERLESGLIGMDDPMFTGAAPGNGDGNSLEPGVLGVQGKALDAGGHDTDSVQQIAAQGVESGGGALPYLDRIQASFGGHDVSGVRAHVGGEAADAAAQIGAEAYATGNDVAFSQNPDLHTAAHEATHVVQQRGGVQLKGGVGEAGDRYEQQADAVADLVVQGASAEHLLGQSASTSASSSVQRVVQRWEAEEHRQMGNEGAGGRMVTLAKGYSIPFGEMTALAGDHFHDIAQMRKFAKNTSGGPCSREEIEWVRQDKGYVKPKTALYKNEKIKESAEARYYKLAGKNVSHFLNSQKGDTDKKPEERAGDAKGYLNTKYNTPPPGGSQGYRMNHVWAIKEAVEAGAKQGAISSPMAVEAFGSHYLTDAFASGHVRTPRLSIKEYWDPKVPMFPYNMTHFIAHHVAEELNTLQKVGGVPVPTNTQLRRDFPGAGSLAAVTKLLETKKFTFGDVVSLALHDMVNATGIEATSNGDDVTLLGDGTIMGVDPRTKESKVDKSGDGWKYGTTAVKMGVADIERAYQLGKQGMDVNAAIDALLDDGLFAPEKYLPVPKDDSQQTPQRKSITWEYATIDELFADARFTAACKKFIDGKRKTLKGVAEGLGNKEQQNAFERGVIKALSDKPIETLKRVVNYVPSDGFSDTEGAASYYRDAEKTGKDKAGAKGLTLTQRIKLVNKLTRHYSTKELYGLLDTAPTGEAIHLFNMFGYDRLRDIVTEKGKFSTKFDARFPKKTYKLT